MLPKSPRMPVGLHLLIPVVGRVGGLFQLTKISVSEFCNESADTPFTPVSACQGPQDAPGLHLLVPGVGGVGATLR